MWASVSPCLTRSSMGKRPTVSGKLSAEELGHVVDGQLHLARQQVLWEDKVQPVSQQPLP